MSSLRAAGAALVVPLLGAAAVLTVLTGCSSSGSAPVPAPSTTTPTSSGPPVLSATLPRTAHDLAVQMRHGLAVATSARVAVTRRGAAPVRGTMTLAAGLPTALSLTSGSGARTTRILVVNSVAYARVGTRPKWTPVPAAGRVAAQLRPVRATLHALRTIAYPVHLLSQVELGTVRLLGRGAVAGVPAAHYLLINGSTRTDLWVDGGSRPLTATVRARTAVRFSAYGTPVRITAPAPSRIAG